MSNTTSKKVTPWIVATALFMETLDATILSTAVPSMAHSFSVNPLDLKLALISYILSLAIFIPISGWIAERLGTKTTFIYAIALFTISSIGCGLSSSLSALVIGRIVQGIGGALMMPVGRLIMLHTFNKSEFIRAINFMTTPALLGPVLGPFLGGLITTYYTWPWIFYINVPIGIIGIVVSSYYIKNLQDKSYRPFDLLGFLLFSGSMLILFTLFEVIQLPILSLTSMSICFILAGLGLFFFYFHYRRTQYPVIEAKLFKLKTFSIAALGNFFSRLGISSIYLLLPLFFQIGNNLSPLYSGLLIALWPCGMIFMKFFSKKILCQFGFNKILPLSSLFTGLTIMCFSKIMITNPISLLILFVSGIFSSINFLGMNTLYYAEVKDCHRSSATSIVSTIQHLSNGIGISITAFILQFFIGSSHSLTPGSTQAFQKSFIISGGLTCLASFIFLFLKRDDGLDLLQK